MGLSEVSSLSGTTCCAILFKGPTLYAANVGDSRAILVTERAVTALTVDQKPEDFMERKRILESGGSVHRSKNSTTGVFRGPERVWLPKQKVPGLAMSRSIGDYMAHTVGVSADPIVTVHTI